MFFVTLHNYDGTKLTTQAATVFQERSYRCFIEIHWLKMNFKHMNLKILKETLK